MVQCPQKLNVVGLVTCHVVGRVTIYPLASSPTLDTCLSGKHSLKHTMWTVPAQLSNMVAAILQSGAFYHDIWRVLLLHCTVRS